MSAVKLLDRTEAASRLRVSERTVRRYAAAGLITEVAVGPRLKKVTEESVDRLLADGLAAAANGRRQAA